MPTKYKELLAGNIAKELFGEMAVLDKKTSDALDKLLFALLEKNEKTVLPLLSQIRSNQRLAHDIHTALSYGDTQKALKLIGMDKS